MGFIPASGDEQGALAHQPPRHALAPIRVRGALDVGLTGPGGLTPAGTEDRSSAGAPVCCGTVMSAKNSAVMHLPSRKNLRSGYQRTLLPPRVVKLAYMLKPELRGVSGVFFTPSTPQSSVSIRSLGGLNHTG